MNKYVRPMMLSLVPSLLLGVGFYFLIAFLGGMDNIANTSFLWIFVGTVLFVLMFVLRNNGKNIFGRFLKYTAYECWLSPLCVLIYTVVSMSQADSSIGGAGAAGAGIAGFLIFFVVAVVGTLTGLVLYLISNSISKSRQEKELVQKA